LKQFLQRLIQQSSYPIGSKRIAFFTQVAGCWTQAVMASNILGTIHTEDGKWFDDNVDKQLMLQRNAL
jgi:hypothetical protein